MLQANEFLENSGTAEILRDLKEHFKERPFIISDVTDEQGNQYVDLVQEGGGVLGIALVGYTYILEKMGIRFFSLAGTSAGSINAMLLACTGNKEDEKSSRIVEHLAKLDMFSFVDGKPGNNRFTRWIKKIIGNALSGGKVFRNMMRTVKWTMLLLLLSAVVCFIFNFFFPGIAKWLGVAALGMMAVISIFIFIVIYRFRQFAKDGYGLNCGDTFHGWIKNVIESCDIANDPGQGKIRDLAGFSKHFMRVPMLKVKKDERRSNNNPPLMPMLTIITVDIISERKIEFPRMWDLYWKKQEDVHPGDFVRASMSIPVFFETYSVKDIRINSNFAKWDQHLNWQNENKNIPLFSQFIDGGTLSNFPINVFYNPNYPVPRMPTFGIRLQDGILDAASRSNSNFIGYVKSLFSSIRFNFDRDFITKNRAYTIGVKNIDVRKHNWLNFFMDDKEKMELFRKGAAAASEFLKSFDWESYKTERLKNFAMREEQFENPNNFEIFPYQSIENKRGIKQQNPG